MHFLFIRKIISLIIFSSLYYSGFSQSLELNATLGFSYGINKQVSAQPYSTQFTAFSEVGPMSGGAIRWNINEKNDFLELFALSMGEWTGARVKIGGYRATKSSGNIDYSYGLAYGQQISFFRIPKLFFSIGVGTEYVVRGRGFPRTSLGLNGVTLLDIEAFDSLQPFGYVTLGKDFSWKRHHIRVQLRGRVGFKYNQFYYFQTNAIDGVLHEMVVAKKGDIISLSISYGFEVLRFN